MTARETYAGLEPAQLWRHFAALNGIPRPSGQEAAARAYVRQVAETAGVAWREDARGNIVVHIPATAGHEGAPVVAVQAHLDMVCEKRPDVAHDFAVDPIVPRRESDRICASGTTLGADNGIGAAAALALLTEPHLTHGPLELLFTVDEETGLHGALGLDPALVTARRLINLDSEDPRELTVGCAGGAGAMLRLPVETEERPLNWVGREIVVSGLQGGHSGIQIHEPLANAIKLLAQALEAITKAGIEFRLAALHGGTAHNAIPRDATATIALPPAAVPRLESRLANLEAGWLVHWSTEPTLALTARPIPTPERVLLHYFQLTALLMLEFLPHGVLAMSEAFPGKVETSSNLAEVKTYDGEIEIATSSRSFVAAELEKVQQEIWRIGEGLGNADEFLAALGGSNEVKQPNQKASVELRDGYPGWEPNPDSALLAVARRVYAEVFGTVADVQVVHAGLECGVIAAKLPGLDAISFGPRIDGAHSPDECVHISTVDTTWRLLTALLAALAQG